MATKFKLFDMFTVKYDVNGNPMISISGKALDAKRGVSFQLGELGITSIAELKLMSLESIKQHIFNFVKDHGTKRQKYLFCTNTKITLS